MIGNMNGGLIMAVSNINIRVDSEVKAQAQHIFALLGLDMSAAVNIFLRQAVRQRGIPFLLTTEPSRPVRKTPQLGAWEGKVRLSDDFDAPLEDFGEY
ncbi:MAG: type II toxin-antitoxin system RelB/DinJ family antitoxin, partial [Candidatus Accumulibacter sp.]|nr:type II toxin-antitoxin system RelB/DinJ family antitoxin [Accumulibacter sp.]